MGGGGPFDTKEGVVATLFKKTGQEITPPTAGQKDEEMIKSR